MTEARQLAELMREFGLTRIEYDKDGTHIELERQVTVAAGATPSVVAVAAESPIVAVAAESIAGTAVAAPIVGVVYAAREPGAAPFVTVGQSVKKGDTVCVIEAMKMFCDVEASCDGTVAEVRFEDGALAEFGQTLVVIAEV